MNEIDPEDFMEVMPLCLDICRKVIDRYEGYITEQIGEDLSVCFGYPAAHEDEAKRAVSAGLGILEGIRSFSHKLHEERSIRASVRVGLHTGLVMVRDSEKNSGSGPIEIIGETPRIASQITSQSESDNVMASETTYQLVKGFFETRSAGEYSIKGLSKAIPIYSIIHQSVARSRLEVELLAGFTPLSGRKKETALLQHSWQNAHDGIGQVVLLRGEAGIGKSRLLQEIKDHAARDSSSWLIECFCSPYFQGSALYPIIELLKTSVLEFDEETSNEEKLKKLEGFLVQYGSSLPETVPLFCSLLSIPLSGDYKPLALTPEAQKNKIIEVLINLLFLRASEQPVLFIVDDLHWADPTTIELLKLTVEHVPSYKILTILTSRPEFQEPWDTDTNLTKVSLNRLSSSEMESMVLELSFGKKLPADVLSHIKEKTDGVPLFIEELTKMILDSGILVEQDENYTQIDIVKSVKIPATLHDSLMARLDKMGQSKEIAQLGATIGREFSFDLIHAVSQLDEEILKEELHNLVKAEILYRKGLLGKKNYVFKHALIQDTAYQSILKSKRKEIHQNIAQVLENKFTHLQSTQPELFAHHYTEAGIYDQAVNYWQQSGMKSLQSSANLEAISHLTRGLDIVSKFEEGPQKDQTELMLQATLGPAVIATQGFGSAQVGEIYRRSAELCTSIGETPHLFPSIWGQWVYNLVQANLNDAKTLSEEMLTLGENYNQSSMLVEGRWTIGNTLFWLGEFDKSRENLEKAIELYDPAEHHKNAYIFGQDPLVGAHCYLSYTEWYLGYPDKALNRTNEILEVARNLNHPFSIGWALAFGMMVAGFRRDPEMTMQRTQETIDYCQKQAYPFWLTASQVWLGWAMTEKGDIEEGINMMKQGLAGFDMIGSNVVQPLFMGVLAEVLCDNGIIDEAYELINKAVDKARANHEKASEIDLYRIKAAILMKMSDDNKKEAEKNILIGIEMADQLNARSRKLRALIDLYNMHDEGSKKLKELYDSFTEGHSTRDLILAEMTLQQKKL
jgi:class 3 adenylate cyclase/predicted ATPase